MFVNNIVFSLVDSFLAWHKHLSPCMGASKPLHVGNFCTLKKQVEMIFMGLSGRRPLSPHMQHSFLCPLIPSTCNASYSNLPHVPYFIQIKATKNFKFDSTQFVNLIEPGFKKISQTLKTGHPEGMLSNKIIRDYVNFPRISSKNGCP